jgi:hypothetical protein
MAQLVGTFISSHAPMMAAAVESAPEEQRRNFLGGVGDSGWGREGGDYSRELCTEPKAIVMDI